MPNLKIISGNEELFYKFLEKHYLIMDIFITLPDE